MRIKYEKYQNLYTLESFFKRVFFISNLEKEIKPLSNHSLLRRIGRITSKITNINKEYDNITNSSEALDPYLNEVFAISREASKRVLGLRLFDVQILGGLILHHGCIGEIKTGEGKTLIATLPAILNSMLGMGVHIVTTNNYLAARDSEWMGKVYKFLNIKSGCISPNMS